MVRRTRTEEADGQAIGIKQMETNLGRDHSLVKIGATVIVRMIVIVIGLAIDHDGHPPRTFRRMAESLVRDRPLA